MNLLLIWNIVKMLKTLMKTFLMHVFLSILWNVILFIAVLAAAHVAVAISVIALVDLVNNLTLILFLAFLVRRLFILQTREETKQRST